MSDTISRINPKVSYSSIGQYAKNGSKTDVINLYTVLKQCASGNWKDRDKGSVGCIFPYESTIMTSHASKYDGVIFIDIDKFDEHPEIAGIQKVIFDRFDDICKHMPCLLALKYSSSGNLHAFAYHIGIEDGAHYKKLAALYLCWFAKAVKVTLGVDLRDYADVLDTHLIRPYQKFFVNDTPFKWNIYCDGVVLSRKDMSILKAEYANLLSVSDERSISNIESTVLTGNGDIKVDRDYKLVGLNGYAARTAIAAAAYYHFNKDVDKAREWLSVNYSNAEEINKQMTSMIVNGSIERKYRISVEKYLFGNDSTKITLNKDEYLSHKIDFNTLDKKWYYIISNTNTGKTEFVKCLTKIEGNKIIILQMNKALRDGKKQGIEDITYVNGKWDKLVPKEQVHTTVEGFITNCQDIDLSEYTVVVDEAHLLQDYCAIEGKLRANRDLLEILPNAKKCIFMSATPKSDIKLYPFERLEFEKVQEQTVSIKGHPIKIIGKGSKEAAKYQYMLNYIKKMTKETKTKSLIFSNKHQESWKKYGLADMDYTWFHSRNKEHEYVESILTNNKLLTDITLATNYLGVGVEIKNEKEIHIWFDLDEGWDKDFIVQSIGRPRDAKTIYLHFFYDIDKKSVNGRLNDTDIESLQSAFDNLIIDSENADTYPSVNLIAAKMTGIYDAMFKSYKCNDKITMLKMGQLISNRDYFSIFDVDLLKRLPYEKITFYNGEQTIIDSEGKDRIVRKETELEQYLISKSNKWWNENKRETITTIINDSNISITDMKNAEKVIQECKRVWKSGLTLDEAVVFFGTLSNAMNMVACLDRYCKTKSGLYVIDEFEGMDEDKYNDTLKEFDAVEKVFSKEYIDFRIEKYRLDEPIRTDEIEFDYLIQELMGLNVIDGDIEKTKSSIPYPYNGSNYKECIKPLVNKDRDDRIKQLGKSNSKKLTLQHKTTGEVLQFDSQIDAANHFKVQKHVISRKVQGKNVKNLSDWLVIL